jgi:hypothetical protein
VLSSRDEKPDDPNDKKHRRNDPQHVKGKPKACKEKYNQQCQQDEAHFEITFVLLRDRSRERRNRPPQAR